MAEYFLGLGSNIEAERHLLSGVNYLAHSFRQMSQSAVYRSAAYGFKGADFLNMVVRIESAFGPVQLKKWLREVEFMHGRQVGQSGYGNRTLDIDLLLVDRQSNSEQSALPRPEALSRAYVLKPLQDLAPNLKHPTTGQRLAELWQAFADKNSVKWLGFIDQL